MEQPRPRRLLAEFRRDYPGVFKKVDALRADQGRIRARDPEAWPTWCFFPLGAAYAAMIGRPPEELENPQELRRLPEFAALATWRVTQGVYRFDPDVSEAVWETPLEDKIPSETLMRLPEWCVYVETPGKDIFGFSVAGFFAHLVPSGRGNVELRFLFDVLAADEDLLADFPDMPREDGTLYPFPWMLDLAEPDLRGAFHSGLRNVVEDMGESWGKETPDWLRDELGKDGGTGTVGRLARQLEGPVSLLLYLCSVSAEYRDAAGSAREPANPAPKKTKKGPRLFPPHEPTVWETAYRMGAALRTARAGATGDDARDPGDAPLRSTPRPHVRRAHWHAFWRGPRSRPEERELVVKWLPPTAVNVPDDDAHDMMPAVVKAVEGGAG